MSENITHLPPQNLTLWLKKLYQKAGFAPTQASTLTKNLVQTSLWGIDSHGVARTPHYLNRVSTGSINPRAKIAFKKTGPCTGKVNGDNGHGIVIMNEATRQAIKMAKGTGIAAIGIQQSSHCGAIGLYGRQIAQSGLIGIVFTHSDAFVAHITGGNPSWEPIRFVSRCHPWENPFAWIWRRVRPLGM